MKLTNTQKIALNLIIEDLRFVYSVLLVNKGDHTPSYSVAIQPYLGLITDGIEQWARKVNSIKKYIPRFTEEAKFYYTEMRNSIKIWNNDFLTLNKMLQSIYIENDIYYSSKCKPIAKKLNLYDIYGCFICNGFYCDNTILDCIFTPYFKYGEMNGEYRKSMSIFLGKLIRSFGANELTPLSVDNKMKFAIQDYCGFVKSPTKHRNYDKSFLLFSLLCTINFLILCVDKYVLDESPTKLRFIYVQYFYLVHIIQEINGIFKTNFKINNTWHCEKMRNCMAHYGIGNVLCQDEVITNDAFGGLTYKLFDCDWLLLKSNILAELKNLAEQLQDYINI